jgi:chromosomal replication initiation ATPase DnaA
MYLAKELTAHSPTEIGRAVGQRDRTTVNHAVNQVRAAVHTDSVIHTSVNNLRRRLGRPS